MRLWRLPLLLALAYSIQATPSAADAFTPDQQGIDVMKSLLADDARTGIFSKGRSEFDYAKWTGPFIVTSAAQIVNDYDRNEISADEKYKGVLIVFSAKISAIRKDALENRYISIDSELMLHEIQARMDESITTLSKLSKGDPIGLVCRGASYVLLSPILEHCRLSKTYTDTKAQEASQAVADWLSGGKAPPFLDTEKKRTLAFYLYFVGNEMKDPAPCTKLGNDTKECFKQVKSFDAEKSRFQSALDRVHSQLDLVAEIPKLKH